MPQDLDVIPQGMFESCVNLGHIDISNNVKEIGAVSFANSGLVSLEIPKSVTTIGYEAFSGCDNLKEVIIHDNLKDIEEGAFNACKSLTEFKVPMNISTIKERTFKGCKSLATVYLPKGIKIAEDAFDMCDNLERIIHSEAESIQEDKCQLN